MGRSTITLIKALWLRVISLGEIIDAQCLGGSNAEAGHNGNHKNR